MVMRSGAIVLLAALTSSACVRSDAVRPGMTQAEVVEHLGKPSEVISDAERMRVYTAIASCEGMERAHTLFWYRKWIPSDIFVSLDAEKKVLCSWEADVVEFVH